jgi:hypothetical protein
VEHRDECVEVPIPGGGEECVDDGTLLGQVDVRYGIRALDAPPGALAS